MTAKTEQPKVPADPRIACTPMYLPGDQNAASAAMAVRVNPLNHSQAAAGMAAEIGLHAVYLAVVRDKWWHSGGVDLPVSFMDITDPALQARILLHMNAWGQTANIVFRQTNGTGTVRISTSLVGHWSYIGTDILLIDRNKPTMNLQGFTMNTPDSEFHRVVRHETGHTIGCPHEHMRKDLIDLINREAAITYYMQTQNWTRDQVIAQVLTPLDENSLWATERADMESIMCYQIPGSLTKNGAPILGGADIDASDYAFIASIYPKLVKAPVASPSSTPGSAGVTSAHALADACVAKGGRDQLGIKLPSGMQLTVPAGVSDDLLKRVLAIVA